MCNTLISERPTKYENIQQPNLKSKPPTIALTLNPTVSKNKVWEMELIVKKYKKLLKVTSFRDILGGFER